MNHPVHIVDVGGNQSPSAFIPFCTIGSTTTGLEIPGFTFPVCTLFKPSLHNGQMCYKLDLNDVRDEVNIASGMNGGLSFLMDYNEDRMINGVEIEQEDETSDSLFKNIRSSESAKPQASIHIDTLGRLMDSILASQK